MIVNCRKPSLLLFVLAALAHCAAASGPGPFGSIRLKPLRAGTVTLRPKYTDDVRSGLFGKGIRGQALGLCGRGPEYPVLYNTKRIEQGTVSFWFKPCRALPFTFIQDSMVSLSDGSQTFHFHFYRNRAKGPAHRELRLVLSNPAFKNGRWYVLNRDFGNELCGRFHHLACTWDQRNIRILLDGETVVDINRTAKLPWPAPFDGNAMRLTVCGPCVWFDEVIVTDRRIANEDFRDLYDTPAAWRPNPSTVFHAGFDGDLRASAYSAANGDLLRIYERTRVPQATYRTSDPKTIEFALVNTTSIPKQATLAGTIRGLDRDALLRGTRSFVVPPGHRGDVSFRLEGLKKRGLFWGRFDVEDEAGTSIRSLEVPFATTLCPDVTTYPGADVSTGLATGNRLTAPVYDKWERVTYEARWRVLESAPDRWDFSRLDMIVGNLVATKRQPVLILASPPEWRLPPNPGKRKLFNRQDLDSWRDYVRRVGERYRDQVFHYMFVGEAYHKVTTGQITTDEYITMVNTSAEVLHRVNPEIKAGFDICTHKPDYVRAAAKRTAKVVDFYIIHPYPFVNGARPRLVDDSLYRSKVIDVLKEHGATTTLADTEVGVYTFMKYCVHPDGRPMTLVEFNRSGNWQKWPQHHRWRGKESFVDFITGAFRVVRGTVLDRSLDCMFTMHWSARPGAFSSLNYKWNAPSPMSVAFANTCGMLLGRTFVNKMGAGNGQQKAYVFRKRNEPDYLVATWTDGGADESICLNVDDDETRVIDHMGNDCPFERIGPIVALTLKPLVPLFVTGLRSPPSLDRPFLTVAAARHPLIAGRPAELRLNLSNPFDRRLTGALRVHAPAGFGAIDPLEVDIAPHAEQSLSARFGVPAGTMPSQTLRIAFNDRAGRLAPFTQNVALRIKRSAVVPRRKAPIRIDGALNEWGAPDAFPIQIDQPEQVRKGNPYTRSFVNVDGKAVVDWQGVDDCSVTAKLTYDDATLYLAIRGRDDTVITPPAHAADRDGDLVEILLARASAPDQTRNPGIHISLIPPSRYFRAVRFAIHSPNGLKSGAAPGDYLKGLRLQGDVTGDSYVIELSLPLLNLGPNTAGRDLDFELIVSDLDDPRKDARKCELRWAGDGDDRRDTSTWGRLVLE